METYFSFHDITPAVIKLLFLVVAGFIVFMSKIIDERFLSKMSLLLINVLFPALIVHKTVSNFNFTSFPLWWVIPVWSFIFSGLGVLLGGIIFKVFRFKSDKDEFICSVAFQNAGYLPMNLILFSFGETLGDRLLIYLFLFLTGFNFVVWTFVPLFLKRNSSEGIKPSHILNAPVMATIFSLLWMAIFGNNTMPSIIMDPLKQAGQVSFPMAMIVLGGYLALYRAYNPENKFKLISSVISRLIIFPALVFTILYFLNLRQDLRFFLGMEAIMPTAVSLVVIGAFSEKNNRFFSSAIFYSHVFSIFTIPLWMEVFNLAFGA